MAFDYQVFPLGVNRFSSIITFDTTIIELDNGAEQRNANWDDSRLEFDAGGAVKTTPDLKTLIEFYRARKGAARGFLVKDWSDFKAQNEEQLGSHTLGVVESFQLHVTYGDSSNTDLRNITKAIVATLQLRSGATVLTPTTHYTVASTSGVTQTGLVTLTAACPTGVITADFEFYVPCRFQEDKLRTDVLIYKISSGHGQQGQVLLIETRDFQ